VWSFLIVAPDVLGGHVPQVVLAKADEVVQAFLLGIAYEAHGVSIETG
jgi:hypothetical protein